MNADGSDPTRLTNNPSGDEVPTWSPDGKQIVFNSDRDGMTQIYIMNADGSGQTALTHNQYGAGWPSWTGPVAPAAG